MSQVIELKGSVMSFTVLKVHGDDMEAIQQTLKSKVDQAPGFFQNVPVVIEPHITGLAPTFLAQLVEFLRQLGMMPIGVRTEDEALRQQAEFAGLALFGPDRRERAAEKEAKKPAASSRAPVPAKVVQTVRSGQQVYGRGRDLIVLGNVNPGAEVYADGHIHIYGSLKGRAFAGAQGARESMIFVHKLDAELVCIAGLYKLAEDIPEAMNGHPCRIWLEHDQLKFSKV